MAMVDRAHTLPSMVTLMGEELNARGHAAANRRAGLLSVIIAMVDFYSLEMLWGVVVLQYWTSGSLIAAGAPPHPRGL